MAAPALDGFNSIAYPAIGGASPTVTLTTLLEDDIIVLVCENERGGGSTRANITSITGGGLSFQRRSQAFQVANFDNFEIWWARAPNPLTAVIFTVNFDATNDDLTLVIFGVNGCSPLLSPWDTDTSLPSIDNTSTPGPTTCIFSTTEANDFVICAFGAVAPAGNATPVPAGYTEIDSNGTSGGGLFSCAGVGYKQVTSTITNESVTWPQGGGHGMLILDALTADPKPTQLSLSGRVVTAVATSLGDVFYAQAGDTEWTAAGNASTTTPPLSTIYLNFAAANQGKLWFVDGSVYRVFDPATGTVSDWVATAGSLPITTIFTARLIETWRGRTVLSGVVKDPSNWFMSAIGDPTNWDYAPPSFSPADAIAGSSGPQGKVADVITGFCPYSDDVAFLGCNNSLYMFSGDPNANGQISLVSERLGMAWGRAWCKDPYGNLYFFSNRCGIYMLIPGAQPQRISQSIDNLLTNLNTGSHAVTMMWDDRQQGCHVWITTTAGSAAATHYFFEYRTGGWFQDVYSNPNHNPLCACQFDGNNPEDRVVLMGSWDGVVRYLDPNAATDDKRIIQSRVLLGPILTENIDEMLWKSNQAVMGADSGKVTWKILAGKTPEVALAQGEFRSGEWAGGLNPTDLIRWANRALYLEITSEVQWRMELIRSVISTQGKIRMRQKG